MEVKASHQESPRTLRKISTIFLLVRRSGSPTLSMSRHSYAPWGSLAGN